MPIMWWTVGRITTGSFADKQENGGICKIAACHRFLAGKKCLPMGHITCVRGAGSPVDIMCPIQKNGAKHLHSTIYQSHIEQRQTFERSVFQHAVSPKSGLTVLIGTPLRRALSCSYSTRVTSSTKAFSFGVAVDQVTLNRRQT